MSCEPDDCNCSGEDCNCLCFLCVGAAHACGEQATLGGGATGAGRPESKPTKAALEEPLRVQLPPLYVMMERG